MSRLTNEEVAALADWLNSRLMEFNPDGAPPFFDTLSRGVVRVLYDGIQDWEGQHEEERKPWLTPAEPPIIGDDGKRLNATMRASKAKAATLNGKAPDIWREASEFSRAQADPLGVVDHPPSAREAEDFSEFEHQWPDMPDPSGVADHLEGGVDLFEEEHGKPTGEPDEAPTAGDPIIHTSDNGYISLQRVKREPRQEEPPKEDEKLTSAPDASEPSRIERPQLPASLGAGNNAKVASVLGPEHTVVTPLKNRAQRAPGGIVPDPDVAREKLATALANGAAEGLHVAMAKPRTLAEVDGLDMEEEDEAPAAGEEIRSLRMTADQKAAQLREIIYALQDMASDGEMPSINAYHANKPPHLPLWQTIMGRWPSIGTWGDLASRAGLTYDAKRKSSRRST